MQIDRPSQEPPQRYGTPEDLDDEDDFYDSPAKPDVQESQKASSVERSNAAAASASSDSQSQLQLPGLGSFSSTTTNDGPHSTQLNGASNVDSLKDSSDMLLDARSETTVAAKSELANDSIQPSSTPPTSVVAQQITSDDNSAPDNLPFEDVEMGNAQEKAQTGKEEGEHKKDSQAKDSKEREFIQAAEAMKGDEQAEWELDSDPESSSDDSSTDSSDSDSSSEDDDDYPLLSPEEQARILMAEGGDDEDGPVKPSSAPKTQNEQPSEEYKKPDVTITPEMQITELGKVMNTVGNVIVILGNTTGEYQVLESGSVVCLQDRKVIGVVSEPMGPVQGPLYSVGFSTATEITELGIEKNTKIYYVNQLATYVFTKPLRSLKGTDASNLHDEEVNDHEMEFSDDEAEAEYKRSLKRAKKSAKEGTQNPERPIMPLKKPRVAQGSSLNYDDDGDDLYTPLARPSDFSSMVGAQAEHVQENWRPSPHRGGRGGPQRGRPERDRGGRRDFGGRGRGSRSSPDQSRNAPHNRQHQRRGDSNGYNHNRKDWQNNQHNSPPNQHQSPQSNRAYNETSPVPASPISQRSFPFPGMPNLPNYPQIPFPNLSQNAMFPPPPPPPHSQNLPAGAYINPNFFRNQQSSPPVNGGQQQWSPPPPPQIPQGQQAQGQFNLQQLLQQLNAQGQQPQAHQAQGSYSAAQVPQQYQQQQHQQQGQGQGQHNAAFDAAQLQLDILRRLSQGQNPSGQ